jgi:hypothetical protein
VDASLALLPAVRRLGMWPETCPIEFAGPADFRRVQITVALIALNS